MLKFIRQIESQILNQEYFMSKSKHAFNIHKL